MRKPLLFSSVLSLFLLVPASITWAQTISTQKGLTTAVFNTPYGNLKIYLPDDIRPGDLISGTIVAEPSGKNMKQVQKNLSGLTKYSLNIDGNKLPVQESPGLFKWLVHTDKKIHTVIELIHVSGMSSGQLPLQFNRNKTVTEKLQDCKTATHALTGSPFYISGPFDGDASNTKCLLENKPSVLLAESPRQCIISYPADGGGIKTLNVQEDGKSLCSNSVFGVTMNISSGKLNLLKGERTYIDVAITGLQHLPDTATLSLSNLSITTVTMLPADFIVIPLPPSETGSGTFNRRFNIQSIKSGNFSVNVNLDLPASYTGEFVKFDLSDLMNESGFPGSYGYKGDEPCNPEGATIKWRWHKTFTCEIDDRQVLPCGHTKEGNDVYEKIKELLEELELDKATDIGEKMAKAFSTAKTFSYSIHVIRKWVDYDIEYRCVNGKWQAVGGVYVKHGTDDPGWHSVKHLSTGCWTTFDSPAAEQEFEEALENALRGACQ